MISKIHQPYSSSSVCVHGFCAGPQEVGKARADDRLFKQGSKDRGLNEIGSAASLVGKICLTLNPNP